MNTVVHSNNANIGGATLTRPRPQPIAGTPPPDPNEKCDVKIIQQTCTLFGIDLVNIFVLENIVAHEQLLEM